MSYFDWLGNDLIWYVSKFLPKGDVINLVTAINNYSNELITKDIFNMIGSKFYKCYICDNNCLFNEIIKVSDIDYNEINICTFCDTLYKSCARDGCNIKLMEMYYYSPQRKKYRKYISDKIKCDICNTVKYCKKDVSSTIMGKTCYNCMLDM